MSKSIDGINIVDTSGPEYVKQEFFKDCEQELIGKAEQEKSVEITQNGTLQVLPDDGKTLSRVTVNTNVGDAVNRLPQFVSGNLTNITAKDLEDIISVRDYAFYHYTQLQNIELPSSVTSIGSNSFNYCSSLKSIALQSVTSIGRYAFDQCKALTDVTLSDSILTIPGNAFSYCSSLVNIIIPDSVTEIGDSAFIGTSIESVAIPYGVTKIGNSTFAQCKNLTSIIIPESVTFLDYQALDKCFKLLSVTIPSGVTKIGSSALTIGNQDNKATIIMKCETPPTIQGDTFRDYTLSKIIVPAGTVDTYKSATNWSRYATYIKEATE